MTLARVRRGIARPLLHRLRRPVVLGRLSRSAEVQFLGYALQTKPGVFHPTHFSSSRILAENLLARPVRRLRVLDMGTGSGPIAIALAAAGACVTACDRNPDAVALTRRNAARNGVDLVVLESDLFTALEGQAFDLIDFNVPFYPSEPTTHFEAAFKAGKSFKTIRRFAEGCRDHLAPNGRVVIVFSEDCDYAAMHGAFTDTGFSLEDERTRRHLLEDFHVAAFRRP